MQADDLIAHERGLKRSLTRRQLSMIGLGGALGTGLFMGSGIAISYAGPGVLLSYVVSACIALAVTYSLSEMAVAHPTAGSFGVYADLYLSPWIGYLVRYTYWACAAIAIGGEAIAIGQYITFWMPTFPVWLSALLAGWTVFFINTRSVASFGTTEYWLSTLKVTAVIVFALFGVAAIAGIGRPAIGFGNYTIAGGPLPHGLGGVWMAVIAAVFSFIGVELIAVTAGEAENPMVSVPRAMKSMLLRLALFYFLALSVILAVTPWNQAGSRIVTQSPFVRVFADFGLPAAATVMNLVIISAALSAMNAQLYLCTRMLFSLARSNNAPAALGVVSSRGTPSRAASVSVVGVLVAAATAYVSDKAYDYLLGISLFGAIVTWIIILVTHLMFRRKYPREKRAQLPVQAPLYPYPQILALGLLMAILITMGMDREFWRISIVVGIPWVMFVSACYLVVRGRRSSSEARRVINGVVVNTNE
ncbi:MAG: amino acid permease [Gammaproteobacteria bacterium]|nr:amino acid permease [Gammaproteobacteria bacterium]